MAAATLSVKPGGRKSCTRTTPMRDLGVGGRGYFLLFCVAQLTLAASSDIENLEADSDFNSLAVHWRSPRMENLTGFRVRRCEDQAWGPHRCRDTVLEKSELTQTPVDENLVEYRGVLRGLRMATNYTLTVTPIQGSLSSRSDRAMGALPAATQLLTRTRGFSARAVSCMTNSTLVEVATGPNFAGKISVEGSLDPQCSTVGNLDDGLSSYRLLINHKACLSRVEKDAIRTFIVVQENLPILTHSTRRFMILCRHVPKAFTVSAGVSLPQVSERPILGDDSSDDVDPSELFDSTNNLLVSSDIRDQLNSVGLSLLRGSNPPFNLSELRRKISEAGLLSLIQDGDSNAESNNEIQNRVRSGRLNTELDEKRGIITAIQNTNALEDDGNQVSLRQGKALRHVHEQQNTGTAWTHVLLTLAVVMSAVAGVSCFCWHFGKQAGFRMAFRAAPCEALGEVASVNDGYSNCDALQEASSPADNIYDTITNNGDAENDLPNDQILSPGSVDSTNVEIEPRSHAQVTAQDSFLAALLDDSPSKTTNIATSNDEMESKPNVDQPFYINVDSVTPQKWERFEDKDEVL